jgi:hypothetical protein
VKQTLWLCSIAATSNKQATRNHTTISKQQQPYNWKLSNNQPSYIFQPLQSPVEHNLSLAHLLLYMYTSMLHQFMIGFSYLSKFKSADVPTEKSTVAILQPLPISPATLFNNVFYNKPRCDKASLSWMIVATLGMRDLNP